MIGDGGEWLREQCIIMAKNNGTDIPFWLSMPLVQLIQWIRTNNRIEAESRKE